jgi:hypothetical protein
MCEIISGLNLPKTAADILKAVKNMFSDSKNYSKFVKSCLNIKILS